MPLPVQGLIKEYGLVEQHESDDEDKAAPGEQVKRITQEYDQNIFSHKEDLLQ